MMVHRFVSGDEMAATASIRVNIGSLAALVDEVHVGKRDAGSVGVVSTDPLSIVLREVCDAIADALSGLSDWGLAGTRPGQYRSDLVADDVAVPMLVDAGFGVLSEESGIHHGDRPLLAVLDPLDGSTNASRGLPWYATSICVLDGIGPLAARVVNHPLGIAYEAVRGSGATRDGAAIEPSRSVALEDAIVALSGFPRTRLRWRQYRTYGACALDLCAVADGTFDAFLDCVDSAHGAWDYLGGLLICTEAGACVGDLLGRELVLRSLEERRNPLAAATPELFDALTAAASMSEAG